jgi:oligopeptidase A
VLLADAEAALERAVGPDVPADYDALSMVLDVPVERLRAAWGHVGHLQAVADTPELRAATCREPAACHRLQHPHGQRRAPVRQVQGRGAARPRRVLSPARRKALADALRDFVLGGAELQGAARERYAAIQDRVARRLSQQFGDHVLDATDAFSLDVQEDPNSPACPRRGAGRARGAQAAGLKGCA